MVAVVQEPQNQEAETWKEVQPDNTEADPKFNGMALNLIAAVEPDKSQTTISEHPAGQIIDDVLVWSEWHTEGQSKLVGILSQPPQSRDKIQIPSSPRKKPAVEILLPCIPAGVHVGPELLGHVGKLKYSDHDVANEAKFLELAQRVFIQTIGTTHLG
jgi:hypothetical protein